MHCIVIEKRYFTEIEKSCLCVISFFLQETICQFVYLFILFIVVYKSILRGLDGRVHF